MRLSRSLTGRAGHHAFASATLPSGGKPLQHYGGYLGETPDFVYIAHSDDPDLPGDNADVVGYERDRVTRIALTPPPEPPKPPQSPVEKLGVRNIALTPLADVWKGPEYGGIGLFR
jgi:hypothetical protein